MTDDSMWDDEDNIGTNSPKTGRRLPPKQILEMDHVYDALGHPRRRYLCFTLLVETEWSLTNLATKIASWENEIPEYKVTPDQRERIYVSLYHAHIPRLVADQIITFDNLTETIKTARNAEQVLAVLEGMGDSVNSNQENHARSGMDE